MKAYTYEFEIFPYEDAWCVFPIGLEGATQGYSFAEAVRMAADWLRIKAEDAEIYGYELPEPVFGAELENGGERVVVTVVTGRECIETVSGAEAARILGVSRPRVSTMLKEAKLEGWKDGRNLRITVESINARLSEPRSFGGRPRKKHTASIAAAL